MSTRVKVGLVLLVSIVSLSASIGWSIIDGSAHDFEDTSGNGDWNNAAGAEICEPCHVPHNAAAPASQLIPLWDHDVTALVGYQLYDSATFDAGTGGQNLNTIGSPDGSSLVCLSCHDGTVALDAFGGAAAPSTMIPVGSTRVDPDMRNDHPVSFTYDAALVAADTTTSGGAGLKAPGDVAVAPLLQAGKVQCSSCHDVHNTAGATSLLRMDNTGSVLCLTCHIK